jgi:surface antigen
MRRKTVKRRAVRYGLLAANVIVLAIISVIVLHNPKTTGQSAAPAVLSSSETEDVANPVDQLSSADIALTVARLNALPETTAITNQAQSQAAEVTSASTNDNVVAKPQVVATALKSRADIQQYVTQPGDTVASVAAKFGISSDSIRWSNNFAGDGVPIGVAIIIPPVNGIVYTVKAGDTADSLAAKYHASRDQILAYNDGEISGLHVGEQIIIPNASQSGAAATAASAVAGSASTSFPWGGGAPIYGGYNGYDYGYCTWYVANMLPVPNNWGNANTWDNLARVSGWTVSGTPRAGAVAQSNRGYFGHVALVQEVSADGTMIKYSDMNGIAGFGRVGYSGWTPISHFDNYIYR